MRTLTLKNHFQGNSTVIENDFIDHYMTKANGEYVKVYLLLLRHLHDVDSNLSISKFADILDCTEKDIIRALKYWAKANLLNIDYDDTGLICGLSLGSSPVAQTEQPPKKKEKKASENQKEDLRQLYFVAEQYIGKPLSLSDIKKINYFFDELNFSIDLIEYLIEYCVENGHTSMHYIESVALAWSDASITSVEEAKESSSTYHKNCFAVLKAFGIKGRNPAQIEVHYIKKWTDEYGFTLDIILEACNRTIANTAKPDFKYADSILSSWLASEVHHLKDIKALDLAHQEEKASKKRSASKTVVTTNRFNNFESRPYDLQSLEQQLLNTQ